MQLHALVHTYYEGLGCIADWALAAHHTIRESRLDDTRAKYPHPDDLDGLIVLGGPMSVHDTRKYPRLNEEKNLIEACIAANKPVLGICLGAQLIADVLGARVYTARNKEIGWFAVHTTEAAQQHPITKAMPKKFSTLHWHGDTFDLPDGAVNLAYSDCTPHQAFLYGDNVLALQFHLETTREWLRGMILHHADELQPALFVQPGQIVVQGIGIADKTNAMLNAMLDQLFKQ